MTERAALQRERPWIMRTYSGHSSASASNSLFRGNLAKGQTGLSIAFDLPTQLGYDPDHPLARGEVGKVGVPISHLGDMRALLEGIPLPTMNTSMTINATAPWLFALYIALAEERGVSPSVLQGTIQNDIIKEYLSRGTYIFPPAESLRLTRDTIVYAVKSVPGWNPMNLCSYHLQEAGATPVQEVAYTLSTAIAVLDGVRDAGQLSPGEMTAVFSRLSFFVNAGMRFVEEVCKLRAMSRLWERLGRERYGVADPKALRFRYGVQVNSLGLTEAQPENNVYRILIEMLSVTLSKDVRARAVQLPAWNEALGLPRPWDQQWSLRCQQVLAHETDLLDHPDIFEGSLVIEKRTDEIVNAAWAEVEEVTRLGGAIACVQSGYIKERLVESNAHRVREIEEGVRKVVGVNCYTEGEPSPLLASGNGTAGAILALDPAAEAAQVAAIHAWRAGRDAGAAVRALDALKRGLALGENVMPLSIAAAKAGITTGEWGGALREVFGEYRAPTGVVRGSAARTDAGLGPLRAKIRALGERMGRNVKILVGKPGLDGHSNGAEQIALRARDAGFEVVYQGIRVTAAQIAQSAVEEGVHLVGLSVLSGSHNELVPEVIDALRAAGLSNVPVVLGGIIP
ncbi:MAG: methylmalonyl-CoA mutase family protein, partial [Polyangiaceae bacterium]